MTNKNENTRQTLIVYSAQWCGDCQKLKAFLKNENIDYENRDIIKDKKWGEELEKKNRQARCSLLTHQR